MKPHPALFLPFLTSFIVQTEAAPEYRQWRPAEFTFQAEAHMDRMSVGTQFSARFTAPDGTTYDVPGFWDGGQTWRLRFAPTKPGKWSYETTAVEVDSHVFTELYAGEVMHGNDPPQQVDVVLGNAEELILAVSDAGDGTSYDHADWADAQFLKQDGSIVYLDDLTPEFTRQGHGELAFRTNIPGQPLRIADRTFERGLGTHASGRTVYKLDGSEVRFRSWVGVDATVKEHGSVTFSVAVSSRNRSRAGYRDPGLHGKTGMFTALPAEGDNPLYLHGGILRVSDDGHSLTYADGTPFFWLGDTWWFCPSDLVPIDTSTNPEIPSAFNDMVQVRKRQGFTTVHMAFLSTIDGVGPFQDATQGANLSPAYWQKVDRYMDTANEKGLMPVIGMGWAGRPLAYEDWQVVWRHMIARYGSHAVTWLVCGEYNVKGTDKLVDQTLSLGSFIKQTDPYHRAMTIHPWACGGDKRQAWDEPWYDIIMFQGGHGRAPRVALYLEAYNRTPAKPVLEGECQYEGIHTFTDADVRNVAYRAIQNGSCGYTYGSQGLWYPTQDTEDRKHEKWGTPLVWWKALRRPGAEQMGIMRRIYETVDWWRLKPAPDALLPVADTHDAEVSYDLVEHFGEAASGTAYWSRLSEADLNCIALHPLGEGEAVLDYPPIKLPAVPADEALKLILAVGISRTARLDDPEHPSDGVSFLVRVNGKEVYRQRRTEKPWFYTAVDLSALAGTEVNISLATTAGENMNWDHALFRHPAIVKVKKDISDPCREAYLSPPPRPIFTKADENRTFLLYFPADPGPGRRLLREMPEGTSYMAVWHDPRSGEASQPRVLAVDSGTLAIPEPPDEQDWVLIVRKQQD